MRQTRQGRSFHSANDTLLDQIGALMAVRQNRRSGALRLIYANDANYLATLRPLAPPLRKAMLEDAGYTSEEIAVAKRDCVI